MDDVTELQPSTAMSFGEFYDQNYGRDVYHTMPNGQKVYIGRTKPYGAGAGFTNFFDGEISRARDDYNAYLENLNRDNEWRATQSARNWDEYMSNTQMQRLVADIKKAGLNPWLAVQNGISTSGTTTGQKADYKQSVKNEKKDNGRTYALIMLAAAKLISALI